mmetsp:Transcript_21190/g.64660  ORF Transcript_21190/g.64660 Transcript_21190/m.64660 type:complete len:128 (-) Transcript_21190:441-824(-)
MRNRDGVNASFRPLAIAVPQKAQRHVGAAAKVPQGSWYPSSLKATFLRMVQLKTNMVCAVESTRGADQVAGVGTIVRALITGGTSTTGTVDETAVMIPQGEIVPLVVSVLIGVNADIGDTVHRHALP